MNRLIISFVFVFLTLSCIGGLNNQTAFALTADGYSSVTADLSADSTFNVNEYPYVADDYSIKVIQVSFDNNGNLFVYTYQPCQATTFLTATEINMNFAYSANPHIYSLVLVSSENTLCKYRVVTTYAPSEGINYINITSISRPWNSSFDSAPTSGTTTNTVAFPVGQVWRITLSGNNVAYAMEQTQVVTILNPFVGFLEYNNGFYLGYTNHCCSHFVAFSTDYRIDQLKEADVYFESRSHTEHYTALGFREVYGDTIAEEVTLDGTQQGSNSPNVFGKTYTWNRIQSVQTFKETEQLTTATETALSGKQWVLRFTETPVTTVIENGNTHITYTDISNVTILRLKFISAGKTYNLGAVMNKTTGDLIPDNENTNEFASPDEVAKNIWERFKEWLDNLLNDLKDKLNVPLWVLYAAAILVGVLVLGVVLSSVFPGIVLPALEAIFKALFWLIALPFKAIAAIIDYFRT